MYAMRQGAQIRSIWEGANKKAPVSRLETIVTLRWHGTCI